MSAERAVSIDSSAIMKLVSAGAGVVPPVDLRLLEGIHLATAAAGFAVASPA
jgi:hypothetical protein